MVERLCDHFFDGVIRDINCAFEFDNLLGATQCVAGQNLQNPVSINLKLHANTSHPFWNGIEIELKTPELPIVFGQFSFTLEDLDLHPPLVCDCVREHFASFTWDC